MKVERGRSKSRKHERDQARKFKAARKRSRGRGVTTITEPMISRPGGVNIGSADEIMHVEIVASEHFADDVVFVETDERGDELPADPPGENWI